MFPYNDEWFKHLMDNPGGRRTTENHIDYSIFFKWGLSNRKGPRRDDDDIFLPNFEEYVPKFRYRPVSGHHQHHSSNRRYNGATNNVNLTKHKKKLKEYKPQFSDISEDESSDIPNSVTNKEEIPVSITDKTDKTDLEEEIKTDKEILGEVLLHFGESSTMDNKTSKEDTVIEIVDSDDEDVIEFTEVEKSDLIEIKEVEKPDLKVEEIPFITDLEENQELLQKYSFLSNDSTANKESDEVEVIAETSQLKDEEFENDSPISLKHIDTNASYLKIKQVDEKKTNKSVLENIRCYSNIDQLKAPLETTSTLTKCISMSSLSTDKTTHTRRLSFAEINYKTRDICIGQQLPKEVTELLSTPIQMVNYSDFMQDNVPAASTSGIKKSCLKRTCSDQSKMRTLEVPTKKFKHEDCSSKLKENKSDDKIENNNSDIENITKKRKLVEDLTGQTLQKNESKFRKMREEKEEADNTINEINVPSLNTKEKSDMIQKWLDDSSLKEEKSKETSQEEEEIKINSKSHKKRKSSLERTEAEGRNVKDKRKESKHRKELDPDEEKQIETANTTTNSNTEDPPIVNLKLKLRKNSTDSNSSYNIVNEGLSSVDTKFKKNLRRLAKISKKIKKFDTEDISDLQTETDVISPKIVVKQCSVIIDINDLSNFNLHSDVVKNTEEFDEMETKSESNENDQEIEVEKLDENEEMELKKSLEIEKEIEQIVSGIVKSLDDKDMKMSFKPKVPVKNLNNQKMVTRAASRKSIDSREHVSKISEDEESSDDEPLAKKILINKIMKRRASRVKSLEIESQLLGRESLDDDKEMEPEGSESKLLDNEIVEPLVLVSNSLENKDLEQSVTKSLDNKEPQISIEMVPTRKVLDIEINTTEVCNDTSILASNECPEQVTTEDQLLIETDMEIKEESEEEEEEEPIINLLEPSIVPHPEDLMDLISKAPEIVISDEDTSNVSESSTSPTNLNNKNKVNILQSIQILEPNTPLKVPDHVLNTPMEDLLDQLLISPSNSENITVTVTDDDNKETELIILDAEITLGKKNEIDNQKPETESQPKLILLPPTTGEDLSITLPKLDPIIEVKTENDVIETDMTKIIEVLSKENTEIQTIKPKEAQQPTISNLTITSIPSTSSSVEPPNNPEEHIPDVAPTETVQPNENIAETTMAQFMFELKPLFLDYHVQQNIAKQTYKTIINYSKELGSDLSTIFNHRIVGIAKQIVDIISKSNVVDFDINNMIYTLRKPIMREYNDEYILVTFMSVFAKAKPTLQPFAVAFYNTIKNMCYMLKSKYPQLYYTAFPQVEPSGFQTESARVPIEQPRAAVEPLELPRISLEIPRISLEIARVSAEVPGTSAEVPRVPAEVPTTSAEVLKNVLQQPRTLIELLRPAELIRAPVEVPRKELLKPQVKSPKPYLNTDQIHLLQSQINSYLLLNKNQQSIMNNMINPYQNDAKEPPKKKTRRRKIKETVPVNVAKPFTLSNQQLQQSYYHQRLLHHRQQQEEQYKQQQMKKQHHTNALYVLDQHVQDQQRVRENEGVVKGCIVEQYLRNRQTGEHERLMEKEKIAHQQRLVEQQRVSLSTSPPKAPHIPVQFCPNYNNNLRANLNQNRRTFESQATFDPALSTESSSLIQNYLNNASYYPHSHQSTVSAVPRTVRPVYPKPPASQDLTVYVPGLYQQPTQQFLQNSMQQPTQRLQQDPIHRLPHSSIQQPPQQSTLQSTQRLLQNSMQQPTQSPTNILKQHLTQQLQQDPIHRLPQTSIQQPPQHSSQGPTLQLQNPMQQPPQSSIQHSSQRATLQSTQQLQQAPIQSSLSLAHQSSQQSAQQTTNPIEQPLQVETQDSTPSQDKRTLDPSDEDNFKIKITKANLAIFKNSQENLSEGNTIKPPCDSQISITFKLGTNIELVEDFKDDETEEQPIEIEDDDNPRTASVDSGFFSPGIVQEDVFNCICGSIAELLCECRTAIYCSEECQRIDWPVHEHVCSRKDFNENQNAA